MSASIPEVPDGLPWTIVLGIDPGTVVVGYGAIVLRPEGPTLLAAGTIRASRTTDVPTRLGHIRSQLDDVIRSLKPDVVAVEKAFFGTNVASALRIGEGRGVALSAAACHGARVIEFPPAVAKRTLVGNGGADKAQVAQMVAAELRLPEAPASLDATDALALALTYVHRSRLTGTL
ncbi:MAG: crossover junction endodeoxyribonuclease RuvC [bacterium]|nr:crossover junction endodeoxyribonuclease RuvC [bacterium]